MTPHDMSLPVSPQPFEDAWTLDHTRQLYEHNRATPDFQADARNREGERQWFEHGQELEEQLEMAIGKHLLHLAATVGLSEPDHSEHAVNNFLHAWHKAVLGEPLNGYEARALGATLSTPLVMASIVHSAPGRQGQAQSDDAIIEKMHELFTRIMREGNFSPLDTKMPSCENSGTRLRLALEGWSPSLLRFDPETRNMVPLGEDDIEPANLQHLVIPMPSGTLLVSDWFSNEDFCKITHDLLENTPSMESAEGCAERTRRLASIGVAHVYAGNTCPDIFLDEERLILGHLHERYQDTGQHKGAVTTDLWWITMVDKQVLIDLLARNTSIEQARAEVEEMIQCQDSPIISIQLDPGQYHLYCAGLYEQFPQLFDRGGVDLSVMERPMCVLSRNDLPMRAKLARVPNP